MALPFEYKAVFTSFEYPDFKFSQTDFFHLRDYISRKYEVDYDNRNEFKFPLENVFGFLTYNIKVCYNKKLLYKIDMIPSLIFVVGILFISMFITNSNIITSIIIGAIALVLVYSFSLLIVNGMVRKLIEAFVNKEIQRINKEYKKPKCINCGAELDRENSKCKVCGYPEKHDTGFSNIKINYSYKESDNK